MNDLNLVTFFKASFNIRTVQPDSTTDILWEIVCAIRTWLTDKYNKDNNKLIPLNSHLWSKFKKYGSIVYSLDAEKTVYCKSITYTSQKNATMYWACQINESPSPEYDYASRKWITEIVYRGNSCDGHFDLVVKYRDRAGYIGHYEPQPQITVPRLVKLILQHRALLCHSGNIPLNAFPTELKTGDGTRLRDLIFNQVRDLPLIYISAKKTTNRWSDIGELVISPNEINKCVLGNAFVFYSKSIEFSEELDYLLGKSYQCHNGDIRVYFPKIDTSDAQEEPRRHRLIFASTLETWGQEEVLAIFRKAFAQNSDFFRRVLDYDYCAFIMSREEHEKQMLEKIAAIKSRDEQIESIKNASAEEREEVIEMALEDYDKLKNEYEALFNDAAFPERIVFTEKAHDSIRDCVTAPKLLWSLLYGMATDFYERLRTTPATAAEDFANSFGIEYARCAGSITRKDKNLMRQYQIEYNNSIVSIERHFKKGNNDSDEQSVRVYFAWEPDICSKIIIGHCGKHLDNWTTRTKH